MKKVIFSIFLSAALICGVSVMAQSTAKPAAKAKTEVKSCCADKADAKTCCAAKTDCAAKADCAKKGTKDCPKKDSKATCPNAEKTTVKK